MRSYVRWDSDKMDEKKNVLVNISKAQLNGPTYFKKVSPPNQ